MGDPFSAFGISTDSNGQSNQNNQNNQGNQSNSNIMNIIRANSPNMNLFRNPNNVINLDDTSTQAQRTNSTNHNNATAHGFSHITTELPISLSLNNNNTSNNNNSSNSQTNLMTNSHIQNNLESTDHSSHTQNSNNILKNLRHYVYGADNTNNNDMDHNLVVDLPENIHLPAPLNREDLNKRKNKFGLFSIRLTPYIDNTLTNSTSTSQNGIGLFFEPIIRTAGPGSQLVIGRYTERVREAISKLPEQYHPIVFKSKVISRAHGCFKVDSQGNWFIKDVKSSSGTFLNHQRLSPASTLSKDFLLHDGDILQLGMDFRGGIEEIYKCVKMKIELNRSWKRKANTFNKEALQRIKNLQKLINDGIEEEDCSICLSKIKPCQAIFISPCSHSWHFHCIRRLIMLSYPQFVCPNCRSTCDLEANLSESEDDMDDYIDDDENGDDDDVQGKNDLHNNNKSSTIIPQQAHNNNHNNDIASIDDVNMG